MRLVPKLIIIITLAVLTAMTIIGGLSYFRSKELIYNQVKQVQTAEIEFAAQLYIEQINSIKQTAEIVAKNRSIRRALDTGNSRGINQRLNEIVKIYPYFRYALVLDNENEVFAVSTRNSEGTTIRHENLLGTSFSPPQKITGENNTVTTQAPQKDPHLSSNNTKDQMTQWFSSEIKSGSKTIGRVILSYNWENETTAFLHQTKEMLLSKNSPILELTLYDTNRIWASSASNKPEKFIGKDNWLIGETQIIVGNKPLQLAIISDKNLALSSVKEETKFILILTVTSIILLVSILAYALNKTLVQRIEFLVDGHKNLTLNKLSTRISDLGSDEIGDLAHSFNNLATWLNEATVSKDFVNDIINSTADGLITINGKSEIQLFNPAAEEIFGYELSEVQGQPVEILMRKKERSPHTQYVTNSKLHAPKIINKSRAIWGLRKNGTSFPMELTVSKISSSNEDLFVGIFRDVTERRREEDEKTKFASLLEATLESTDNGILVSDLEGNILQYNSRFQSMWHIDNKLLTKKMAERLRHSVMNQLSDPEGFMTKVGDIYNQPTEAFEDILQFKDGRYFERVSKPMYMGDVPVGRVWSFRDITERRKANEALKTLADEQIILREKAELGERSKSEFLATMSHEIRTPISGILGMAEALLEQELSSDNQRKVEIVYDSGHALMRLLNDILDFSKLEAGKLEIEEIDYSIEDEVDQVFQILMPRIDKKGLTLSKNISDNTPKAIKSDPTRFRQVLYNLIGNAIKFTDTGHITVNISANEENKILSVDVIDTGVGIEKEAIGNLFARFQQADSSTARKFGGSGLGLAICKSLAEVMGGEIGLESELGSGSRFWFTLNYNQASPNYKRRNVHKRIKKFKSTRNLDILVADDSSVIQTVLGEILKSLNHKITFANDGVEAIEMLSSAKFDLIIMDRRMPSMDGMQCTQNIRQMGYSHLPIIGCTADAMIKYKQEFIEAGVDICITKPIDKSELLFSINEVLQEDIHVSIDDKNASTSKELDTETALINLDDLLVLKENVGEDILTILIDDFISTTPQQLSNLNEAISNNNPKEIKDIAHTIKGSAATFGFTNIVNCSKRIELGSYKNNKMNDVLNELEKLNRSFENTKNKIQHIDLDNIR